MVSKCCKAPVLIGGYTTQYYVCSKCKQACDTISVEVPMEQKVLPLDYNKKEDNVVHN